MRHISLVDDTLRPLDPDIEGSRVRIFSLDPDLCCLCLFGLRESQCLIRTKSEISVCPLGCRLTKILRFFVMLIFRDGTILKLGSNLISYIFRAARQI